MEEKKEVQATIIPMKPVEEKVSQEEFFNVLRLVSPGTNLRAGLDGIVKYGKGALIAVEKDDLNAIIDGGFKINSKFTPQRLVELAKMDGAIILSKDMKRITNANVTLAPETKISTSETGTRHKAAERTAKQIGTLAIAVSERKSEITVYYREAKYRLRETSEVLRRASETLHILEKQRELFDKNIGILNSMELRNDLHLDHACKVIQKGKAIEKIIQSQEKTLVELGIEGQALKLRIKEIAKGVEKETDSVIRDYTKLNLSKSKNILASLSYDELIDTENILTALAQKETNNVEAIRGWRLLSKTMLSESEIGQLIQSLKSFNAVINAEKKVHSEILGEEKAESLAKDIERIRNL